MSVNVKAVGLYPLSTVIVMSVGLNNHVLLIPFLLKNAMRDAWISILLAGLLAFAWLPLLYIVIRACNGTHLKDWLDQAYGRFVGWLVVIPILLTQFAAIAATFQDTVRWTDSSYLLRTPLFMVALCIIPLCFFAAQGGIGTIVICSGFFLPMVVLLGWFVMGANYPFKDYSRLTPLFENGYSPLRKGIVYPGSGFLELLYLLLLQHHAKRKIAFKHLVILLVVLVGITIGPVTGSIAAFGSEEASMQRYPAFELWKLVRLGNYIEHMDFFSIFQWLSGAFIRISLGLYLVLDLAKIRKPRRRTVTLGLLCALLLGLTLIPISDIRLDHLLETFIFPYHGLILLVSSCVLAILALLNPTKRKGAST